MLTVGLQPDPLPAAEHRTPSAARTAAAPWSTWTPRQDTTHACVASAKRSCITKTVTTSVSSSLRTKHYSIKTSGGALASHSTRRWGRCRGGRRCARRTTSGRQVCCCVCRPLGCHGSFCVSQKSCHQCRFSLVNLLLVVLLLARVNTLHRRGTLGSHKAKRHIGHRSAQ